MARWIEPPPILKGSALFIDPFICLKGETNRIHQSTVMPLLLRCAFFGLCFCYSARFVVLLLLRCGTNELFRLCALQDLPLHSKGLVKRCSVVPCLALAEILTLCCFGWKKLPDSCECKQLCLKMTEDVVECVKCFNTVVLYCRTCLTGVEQGGDIQGRLDLRSAMASKILGRHNAAVASLLIEVKRKTNKIQQW